MAGFSGNHLTGQYSVSWFFDFSLTFEAIEKLLCQISSEYLIIFLISIKHKQIENIDLVLIK